MKVFIFIVALVSAVAFASWNPESILQGGSSSVSSEGEGGSPGVEVNVTSVDWGVMYPGSVKTHGILLSNVGSNPTSVSLKTENWDPPAAAQFMNLSWNLEGAQILNGSSMAATLCLTVSPLIRNITEFRFDIVINTAAEGLH